MSVEEWLFLIRLRVLLMWSGFIAGTLVLNIRWALQLWSLEAGILQGVLVCVVVYAIAGLVYYLGVKGKLDRYDKPDRALSPIYLNLILAVGMRNQDMASSVLEDLKAHVGAYLLRP